MITYPTNWIKNDKLCELVDSTLAENKPFAWLFTGVPGCGKTAMAELVFTALSKQHRPNWFMTANALYNKYVGLVASNSPEKSRDIGLLSQYLNASLFVLDDLGREITTEASSTFIANMFSEQYESFKEGKLQRCIITTNLHSDQIAKRYGDHVMDRMFEVYTILKFW